MLNKSALESYWTKRYEEGSIGWNVGSPTTPVMRYGDQLTDKSLSILIPGAGNAYEAEHLHSQGFTQVHILDVSPIPLANFLERVPDFPKSHIINADFFHHEGQYDIIIEQTFFCSFSPSPENRTRYAETMHSLLKPGGKLVGLWFDFELDATGGPPYGGNAEEYKRYFEPLFSTVSFEPCENSIKPRAGRELWGEMLKGS